MVPMTLIGLQTPMTRSLWLQDKEELDSTASWDTSFAPILPAFGAECQFLETEAVISGVIRSRTASSISAHSSIAPRKYPPAEPNKRLAGSDHQLRPAPV